MSLPYVEGILSAEQVADSAARLLHRRDGGGSLLDLGAGEDRVAGRDFAHAASGLRK